MWQSHVVLELLCHGDCVLDQGVSHNAVFFLRQSLGETHRILNLSAVQVEFGQISDVNGFDMRVVEESLPDLGTCFFVQIIVLESDGNATMECIIE